MANLVLGFLHDAENLAKGAAAPFAWLGQTDIVNPGKEIAAQVTGNQQAYQNAEQSQNNNLQPRTVASNIGQVGLDLVAPGVASGVGGAVAKTGLTDLGTGIAAKAIGGVAKGAAEGAALGGAQSVAQGIGSNESLNAKNLTMNFLQGAQSGAEFGGVVGGAVGAVQGAVKPAYAAGPSRSLFTGEQLTKLSQTDDPKTITKQVQDQLGQVVADKVAPAIAKTNDPNVVANVIDNALAKHTTPQVPEPSTPTPEEQSLFNTAPQGDQQSLLNSGKQLSPSDVTNEPVTDPAAATPRPFMNAPGKTGHTQMSKLEATQRLEGDLGAGLDVTEATNRYMEGSGENFQDAQKAVNKLINEPNANLQKGQINASKNPLHGTVSAPEAQANDSTQPITNARMIHNQTMRYGNAALAEVDKLSPEDLKLMDSLRGNNPEDIVQQAKDPEQFRKATESVKTYNDFTQAAGSAFGEEIPYRQNYGAPLKFDNSPEGQETLNNAVTKLKTSPGYTKGRYFNNYDEAAQYGAKRLNENFAQDLAGDVEQRASNLSQLTLAKGLHEAFPDQVKVGQIGVGENGLYKQLQIPGGSRLSMPAEVADEINKRAPAPNTTGFWKGYDQLNGNLKNVKLAGGGFHSLNVAGSYVAQQLASGKAFTDPSGIGNMVKATFSKNFMDSELDRLNQSGKLLDADASGLQYGTGETQADISPQGKLGNIPVLKQIHQAIFDRQIPYMKLKIFEQQTKGLNRNVPEDMQKMQSIAKELNQNFGGINREIQGLTPKQFQVAARGFLATDYNEGQIRSLVDAFTKGGAEGKLARQVVFGKALLFGGLATAGGAIGGEFQGQKPQQVAMDILNKFVNPEFKMGGYTVGLPTTQIAEVGKPLEQTVTGAQSGHPLSGLQNFATARLAGIPSEGLQLAGNKNFYGQPLYGTDTHGRPISPGQTLANVASGSIPVPATQTVQTATGNESVAAAVANTVGLRAVPQNQVANLPVAQQTYIQQAAKAGAPKELLDADTQFFSILKQNGYGSKAYKQADDQINRDIAAGNNQKAQQDVQAFNQKLIKAFQPWSSNQANTQYFDSWMAKQLQNGLQTLSNIKSRQTVIKDNPTKYGLTI